MQLKMSEKNKKIEVVDGDGSNLDISPVYNHFKDVKPKGKRNDQKIIVPDEKKISQKNNKTTKK